MDIKTLVFALALGNLSLYAALFFFEYGQKKSLRLSLWAVAKQCQALAWLLFYLRGVAPELLSVLGAGGLLFAGLAFDAGAMWQGAGRGGWRRVLLPALGLALAAWLLCYFGGLAAPLRAAFSALTASAFFGAGTAALMLDWTGATMLRRFLAVGMTLLSAALAARGLLALALPDGWSWLNPERVQAGGLVVLYLMMLSNAFGYLLLARQRQERALVRLDTLDALTEVPNRRGFYQALAPWMALARRPGPPTALIVLKPDHFKRINDDYGHAVGDLVLKSMVEVCKRQLRDSDLMGRLGGAEFAIQLPRTEAADALQVGERIRAALQAAPVKTERAVIKLTASLGVTGVRAEDSTVSLFKRADAALQAAKRGGRNRVAEAETVIPVSQ